MLRGDPWPWGAAWAVAAPVTAWRLEVAHIVQGTWVRADWLEAQAAATCRRYLAGEFCTHCVAWRAVALSFRRSVALLQLAEPDARPGAVRLVARLAEAVRFGAGDSEAIRRYLAELR